MTGYGNVEVRAVAAVAQHEGTVRRLVESALQDIEGSRTALRAVVVHCAQVVRDRYRDLQACEADPEANCSVPRRRYQTALDVQRTVERLAADATASLHSSRERITEQSERAAAWLLRLAAHLDGVGPPPEDVVPSASGGGVGRGGAAAAGGAAASTGSNARSVQGGGGSGVIAGLALPPDVRRVRVADIDVAADIFEREPRSASRDDMVWAATTFRDVVLPHIARGGTKDELRQQDLDAGMPVGYRRLEGAWDAFLGDEWPRVVVDRSGRVADVGNGRHRIRAAQIAGLTWLPMKVVDQTNPD